MPDEIRSIRIESNNICYGPEPDADDEVEQYLTISSTGRVWFSARNYQQYCNSKDYCRKKQVSIDKWKAEFLLRLIDNISEDMPFVTDVGSYDLEIRYANDRTRRISGSLIGNVYSHAYGEEDNVDVTRLIRRFIPVYGLWAFNGSTAPDYEGKKAVFLFAESWIRFFQNPNSDKDFEDGFGRECEILGFQMDCGEKFVFECKKRGCKIPYGEGLKESVAEIDDIEVIGSGAFSYWRGLTHWDYMYHLGPEECEIFLCLLQRLKELSRKKLK
jgi:hypothetical protein